MPIFELKRTPEIARLMERASAGALDVTEFCEELARYGVEGIERVFYVAPAFGMPLGEAKARCVEIEYGSAEAWATELCGALDDTSYKLGLESRLRTLNGQQRTLFAVSCSERALPGYCAFAELANQGDPDLLRLSVDEVWRSLQGDASQAGTPTLLTIKRCAQLMLDAKGSLSQLASAAVEAVMCVVHTLKSVAGDGHENAVSAGLSGRACVLAYVNERGGSACNPWEDPLVLRETRRQERDLRRIRVAGTSATVLESLRRTSSYIGLRAVITELIQLRTKL